MVASQQPGPQLDRECVGLDGCTAPFEAAVHDGGRAEGGTGGNRAGADALLPQALLGQHAAAPPGLHCRQWRSHLIGMSDQTAKTLLIIPRFCSLIVCTWIIAFLNLECTSCRNLQQCLWFVVCSALKTMWWDALELHKSLGSGNWLA